MQNLHYRAETVYQSPTPLTIFCKRLFLLLEEFKDVIGRILKFDLRDEGIFSEVYPGYFGIVL